MKISEIGEFGLIERLVRPPKRESLIVGIGDDAAVMALSGKVVLTTDMLVEGDHFRTEWATPRQIGRKAMASNVSDIAAMGGVPEFAFISIALREGIDVEFMDELYGGMHDVADEFGIDIAGGDTTHGSVMVINVVVMGSVDPPVLRSGASPGELICVTGPLGGSKAGLELLLAGRKEPADAVAKHLDPGCRMDVSPRIAEVANSMIDVSDGLASEVNHICDMSDVGAEVIASWIPLSDATVEAGRVLDADPVRWALDGGEDFELVFTIHPDRLKEMEEICTVVGRTLPPEDGRSLVVDGERLPLTGGYNHFNE